jgi:hypothetical protein
VDSGPPPSDSASAQTSAFPRAVRTPREP